jgi:ketosteroid isomerase-like protein
MDKTDLWIIADEWIKAFNTKDIEALLKLYHENARHYSPRVEEELQMGTGGWLEGKEQLKLWWQGSFERLPQLSYELKDITFGYSLDDVFGSCKSQIPKARSRDTKMFIEYLRRVPGESDLFVMEYFRIQDPLIVESRVLRSWPV